MLVGVHRWQSYFVFARTRWHWYFVFARPRGSVFGLKIESTSGFGLYHGRLPEFLARSCALPSRRLAAGRVLIFCAQDAAQRVKRARTKPARNLTELLRSFRFPRILSHDVWRLEGWQVRLRQPSPKTGGPRSLEQNGLRSAIVARCSVGELGMTGGRSIDQHFEKLVLALA